MKSDQLLTTPLNAPLAERRGTTLQATVCLFKAVVGTGVFAYPPAVREAGYVLATGVAVFFFVINLYTMALLNLSIVAMRERGF
eukprot:COSAG04_NODE_16928_length_485_cov_0.647668_1_plen_83_part_01